MVLTRHLEVLVRFFVLGSEFPRGFLPKEFGSVLQTAGPGNPIHHPRCISPNCSVFRQAGQTLVTGQVDIVRNQLPMHDLSNGHRRI